jgi:hypothetical protein
MARKDWEGGELLIWPLIVIVGAIFGGIAAASKHLREVAVAGGAVAVLVLVIVLVVIANRRA